MSQTSGYRVRFAGLERRGLILGLSAAQTAVLGVGLIVAVLAEYLAGAAGLAATAPIWGLPAVVALVWVRGRPMLEWLPVVAHWGARRVLGATGHRTPLRGDEPAGLVAPGVPRRLGVVTGPSTGAALVHHPRAGTREHRVAGWDRLLASLAALHERMAEVGLELHPDKTKIVYCKDANRRADFEHTSFTFLGYMFRPRRARRRDGVQFVSFLPAISKDALKRIGERLRSWRLHRLTGSTAADLARMINPVVRGWMAYYGAFYRTALYPVLHRINTYLLRWIMKKYKKLRTWKKAIQAMRDAIASRPRYFAHWAWAKPAIR